MNPTGTQAVMKDQRFSVNSDSSLGLPRKLTAIGTVGDVNRLFTVYEKNWNCPDCGQENYASRPRCFRCKKQKPEGSNNYVMDPAYMSLQSGQENPWQEVVDPTSYQIYYYNKETGKTQWERPLEMGQAPMATGWFGRGQAGSTISQMYEAKNQEYLARPARKQKDFIDPNKYHLEGANEYNIWYGKYLGDIADKMDKEPATDRCVLETDAGYTKADKSDPEKRSRRFFCVHFAHGACAKGHECAFYHRVPLPEDDRRCDELFDCFGRQRHNKHRDDMNGVGTFSKPCRTLYVANLQKGKYDSPKSLEDALWRHFGEWGELESINVIHRLSIAFPRYRLRTSAEFAKEAMTCQALDHNEILTIRWAYDDPNPVAQDSIDRANKDALVGLLQAKGISLAPAGYDYPAEYQLPATKRLRADEGGDVVEKFPELAYPNTDAQFSQSQGVHQVPSTSNSDEETREQQVPTQAALGEGPPDDEYYAKQAALSRLGILDSSYAEDEEAATSSTAIKTDQAISGDSEQQEEENEEDEEEEEEVDDGEDFGQGWKKYLDTNTGAYYFFHAETGQSSWSAPQL